MLVGTHSNLWFTFKKGFVQFDIIYGWAINPIYLG